MSLCITKDTATEVEAVGPHFNVRCIDVEGQIHQIVIVSTTIVTTTIVTTSVFAAVPAHHVQRLGTRHNQATVGEAINCRRARFSFSEVLLVCPSIHSEFVLHRVKWQIHRHAEDAISVCIIHGDASAAPSSKGSIQIDRAIGSVIGGHVDLESHCHSFFVVQEGFHMCRPSSTHQSMY